MTRFLSLLAALMIAGSFVACKPKQAAEPAMEAPAPAPAEPAPEAAPAPAAPTEAPPAE